MDKHIHSAAWYQRDHAFIKTHRGSKCVLGMPPDKAAKMMSFMHHSEVVHSIHLVRLLEHQVLLSLQIFRHSGS